MNRYRRHHAIGSIGWADCFECAQQRLQLSYVLVSWRMSATTETAFHRNGRRPFFFPSPCGFSLHSPHRHLPAKDQRLNASAHSVSCSFHCPTHSNALKSCKPPRTASQPPVTRGRRRARAPPDAGLVDLRSVCVG